MALLYHTNQVDIERKDVEIRPLEDEDYAIAITFPGEEWEHAVTEVLLTEEEVKECYDLLFNK